ncbi:MAG: hypothetical protein Q8912_09810 [Bacillota bacterium]|nr:hypothetical protein [Bacillota bacterium]MDP4159724.1 hypothetical protein [Bacillota bacterium]
MSQIPVKFRVAQVIFQKEGLNNQEIFEILKKEYPLDRSVHEKGVQEYLQSLKAVGLIELTDASPDKHGKLKQYYKINDFGASRMKYIG